MSTDEGRPISNRLLEPVVVLSKCRTWAAKVEEDWTFINLLEGGPHLMFTPSDDFDNFVAFLLEVQKSRVGSNA